MIVNNNLKLNLIVDGDLVYINDELGNSVCDLYHYKKNIDKFVPKENQVENAKHIVKCVNENEALHARIKELEDKVSAKKHNSYEETINGNSLLFFEREDIKRPLNARIKELEGGLKDIKEHQESRIDGEAEDYGHEWDIANQLIG